MLRIGGGVMMQAFTGTSAGGTGGMVGTKVTAWSNAGIGSICHQYQKHKTARLWGMTLDYFDFGSYNQNEHYKTRSVLRKLN
jgi:hypothetical protein